MADIEIGKHRIEVKGGGPTQDFGNYESPGASFDSGYDNYVIGNKTTVYTCPVSGNVVGLYYWGKSAGGTHGNVRLALYDSSYNLVCQGSAKVAVDSDTAGWVGHTTFSGSTVVTQDATYHIVFQLDGSDPGFYYDSDTSGNYGQKSSPGDYHDSGFPASITLDVNDGNKFWLKCTVQP